MIFGVELRRRRIAAGLSLADLATLVNYSKGYLSKIENGRQPVSVDVARRCDAELGAGGALVELASRRGRAGPRPDVDIDHDGEAWVMNLGANGTGWFAPVGRRDVLAAGTASLLGLSLTSRGFAAAARQDDMLLALRALFVQVRRIGQMAGPSVVLPLLIPQTRTLRHLAANAVGQHRDQLLLLAARYAEYTGWMAQEAGDDRAALWWTRLAVRIADDAGDKDLAAHAWVRQALITMYQEDAIQTIELARQAQAEHRAQPRIRGHAALREAQGHALAGDYDGFRRTLDRATTLFDEPSAHGVDGLVLGSSTVPDFVTVVEAWCLYDLGRPRLAADLLDRALPEIAETNHRSRARWGARLAMAHAAVGNLDHACALTDDVLVAVELVDSATIRLDLRRLARALTRWRTHQPVRELQPRITAALHIRERHPT
ncbi:MAG TPA: helix-turn-helix transcriptional regulator [Pseudonocardiaceae bacterium]|nr:helix-turn-helix transcriptional regulator [Pseudonocardiaceae bacterium]